MTNELFDAQRLKLQRHVRDAVMDLFGRMGKAAAFQIELRDGLVCVAGSREDCLKLLGQDWLPIDSAPKDGSWFMGFENVGLRTGLQRQCRWHNDRWNDGGYDPSEPTHWMPLPSGPMTKYEGKD